MNDSNAPIDLNGEGNRSLVSECRKLNIEPPPIRATQEQFNFWLSNRVISILSKMNNLNTEGCAYGKIIHGRRSNVKEFLSSTRGTILSILGGSSALAVTIYYVMLVINFFRNIN